MRARPLPGAEACRKQYPAWTSPVGVNYGWFEIPFESNLLRAMVYDGEVDGWEHVSVSLKHRTPNWREMCCIKDLFWDEEEVVVQFHPAKKDYVNFHQNCLHLWRYKHAEFPMPHWSTVGPK